MRYGAAGFNPASLSGLQAWYSADGLRNQAKKPNEVAGLQAWYRADSLEETNATFQPAVDLRPVAWYKSETLPASGAIASWPDSSGNGLDAGQNTSNRRPTVGSINGRLAASFDGLGDTLTAYTGFTGSVSTIFVVATRQNTAAGSDDTLTDTETTNSSRLFYDSTIGQIATHQGGAYVRSGFSPALRQPFIASAVLNGASSSCSGNGVTGTGNPGSNLVHSLRSIGATNSAGGAPWFGEIAELIVFDYALSATERKQVEKYLSEKYNIPLPYSEAAKDPSTFSNTPAVCSVTGLAAWFNAGSIKGLADAAAVGAWQDSSGQRKHAGQATTANQPTYRVNVLNGHPVVRFGGPSFLTLPTTLVTKFSGNDLPITVFAAVKHASATGDQAVMCLDHTSGNGLWFVGGTNGTEFGITRVDDAANAQTWRQAVVDTNQHQFTYAWSADTGAYYKEGAKVAGATNLQGVTTLDRGAIGARAWANSFLAADVAEILIFDRALTDTERESVERYLSKKYALPTAISTLPDQSGHGFNAVQATEAFKPLYAPAAQNGKPAIRFDGTDDGLKTATDMGFSGADKPITVLAVVKDTSGAGTRAIAALDGGSNPTPFIRFSINAGVVEENIRDDASTNKAAIGVYSPGTTNFALLAFTTTGTVATGVHEGITITGGASDVDVGQITLLHFGIGALERDARINFLQGDIAEVIVFDRAISAADRQAVELYLAEKYAINTAVAQWNDRSPNARHLAQTTDARKPLYVANVIGGLPALRLDGTDDRINSSAWNMTSHQATLFMVWAISDKTVDRSPGSFAGITIAQRINHRYSQGADLFLAGNNGGVGASVQAMSTPTLNQFYLSVATTDVDLTTVESKGYFNGVQGVQNTNTDNASAAIGNEQATIGGSNGDVSTDFWKGDVAEYILYDRVLNDGERKMVERYLAGKYGITVAP